MKKVSITINIILIIILILNNSQRVDKANHLKQYEYRLISNDSAKYDILSPEGDTLATAINSSLIDSVIVLDNV